MVQARGPVQVPAPVAQVRLPRPLRRPPGDSTRPAWPRPEGSFCYFSQNHRLAIHSALLVGIDRVKRTLPVRDGGTSSGDAGSRTCDTAAVGGPGLCRATRAAVRGAV